MFSALTARLGIDSGLSAALRTVVVSAGSYGLLLKAHRVVLYPGTIRWHTRPLLLLPDLAFAVGFAALCMWLCACCARLRLPKLGIAVCQALALVLVLFLTITHGYYLASGQTLDYAMFVFSFLRADETFGVVQSEAHWPLTTALCLWPLWLLVMPWRRYRAATEVSVGESSAKSPWPAIAVTALCSALAFVGTYPPHLRGVERTFTRDPVSYFMLGAYDVMSPRERYHGTPTRLRKLGARHLTAPAEHKPKNVALILLESTRWNATTVYAPKLATTPYLAEFAREAVRVERAYAVVPHTSKALVSVFCGYEPEMTVSVVESLKSALPGRCLPALLAAQGYDTVYFQAPTAKFENRGTLVKNLGFSRFKSGDDAPHEGLQRINYFGYEDAVMLEPSRRYIEQHRDKPFFAAYLTSASHHPYDVPRKHKKQVFDTDTARNKYFNAVRYVDGVVKRIIDQYKAAGLYDDTIFLIVGDHGEAFGEHGVSTHDDVMFEEGLRIPLLMRLPKGERRGTRIAGPVSELSIVPTLIDALGYTHDGEYEGASWFQREREPVLHASCYRSDRCAALMRNDKKLIYYFDDREPLLFDLARDPGEQHDLADEDPARVRAMTKELLDLRLSVHDTYRKSTARALGKLVSRTKPEIETPLRASFGEYFDLLGYHAPSARTLSTFGKGSFRRFEMGYILHVKKRLPRGYRLRDEIRDNGQLEYAYYSPVKGVLPLTDFEPGQYIDDTHHVNLPGNWRQPQMEICLALIDEHDIPVPVTGSDGKTRNCMPIMTLKLAR